MEITGSGMETVGFVGKEKRNGVWKGHLGPTDARPPGSVLQAVRPGRLLNGSQGPPGQMWQQLEWSSGT